MRKRIARWIGIGMLTAVVAFVLFALNHPEMSFPWSNTVTYSLYSLYLAAAILFLTLPFRK